MKIQEGSKRFKSVQEGSRMFKLVQEVLKSYRKLKILFLSSKWCLKLQKGLKRDIQIKMKFRNVQ